MSNADIESSALLGQHVDRYELVEILGSGGFASVYRGRREAGQEVAIKIGRSSLEAPENQAAFEREVRIISSLNHPNIIRLLDYGIYQLELRGRRLALPYLVMPLAPGGSLRQLVPRGQRLPLERALDYVQQVAAALQYAHDFREPDGREKAVLHLDVKPANMLVGERGQIWLSDFGIAIIGHKTLHIADPQVAALPWPGREAIWGSPEYMAPERFDGQRRRASDQYALAVTCYEWLAGAPPFSCPATDPEARLQELMRLHRTQAPPPLAARFSDIPPAVEAVIFKALEKDPDQRYPTVRAFAEALEQAVATSQRPSQSQSASSPAAPTSPPGKAASGAAAGAGPAPRSGLGSLSGPGPVPISAPANLFLGSRSTFMDSGASSVTLPQTSPALLKGPAFSVKTPPARPVHFWSGHLSFLHLPDFRLFRFVHSLLIVLAGLLWLIALPNLWPPILLSIPFIIAIFYLAISRRNPTMMLVSALPVILYEGAGIGFLCFNLIVKIWPHMPLVTLLAPLPALAAGGAVLSSVRSYGRRRLDW
ncbi:serine/threonine-protein kinase [Thermogemmatispora sp.]|uniref:serine/threonine-protein kinase n=1 Tax=Thermogemmatispora sp. TaxID=1968838 RepID=UPI0035E45701